MCRALPSLVTALAALAAVAPGAAGAADSGDQPAQAGAISLALERVNGAQRTVVAGDRIRVRGRVPAYVDGQTVVVRFFRGDRKVAARRVTPTPGTASSGTFLLGYEPRTTGRWRVSATAEDAVPALTGQSSAVDVLPRRVRAGARGAAPRALQRMLERRGYVVGRAGVMDARTSRAVLAFRKVTGMRRTSTADVTVMRRLARGAGAFRVRFPGHGRHVEADLSRQVLALIDGGKVERIYHTSSGAPATPTIRGSFRVYRKDLGTNALGMVHAVYFKGGYAIHGYKSVPTGPASHGCLRVPVPDALSIFRWHRPGTRVDVYR